MSDEHTGGPAFPQLEMIGDMPWSTGGLTKRDWFAGLALAGYCASGDLNPHGRPTDHAWTKTAECMYDIADAMLAARNASTPDA